MSPMFLRRHAIGKTIAGGGPYAQELLKHGLLRGGKGSKVYILTPEGRAIAEILIANHSQVRCLGQLC
jgi:hypothetical protein